MSIAWCLPLGYIVLIALLLLRDEYHDRKMARKRLDARAEITWPVTVQTAIGSARGHTKNISATGALIVCMQPLTLGELVNVIIRAPSRSIGLNAEVVRVDTCCISDNNIPHQMIGVRFRQVSEEDSRFLVLAVDDRLCSSEPAENWQVRDQKQTVNIKIMTGAT